jgi:hypothetical protein
MKEGMKGGGTSHGEAEARGWGTGTGALRTAC